MLNEVSSVLAPALAAAHRIIDTIVVRSHAGAIYTIQVGESILDESQAKFGAKVTLVGNPDTHLGVCASASLQEVLAASQNLIAQSLAADNPRSVVPKPHIRPGVTTTA